MLELEFLVWGGVFDVFEAAFVEVAFEFLGLILFAVDQEDFFEAFDLADVIQEVAAVGVAGEGIHFYDFGANVIGIAENVDHFLAVEDFATKGVLGHESYDHNGVAGVFDVVFEVVEDAAAFTHAGSGDNNSRAVEFVDGLGLFNVAGVFEFAETKRVLAVDDKFVKGGAVVAFGVVHEYFGHVGGKR